MSNNKLVKLLHLVG